MQLMMSWAAIVVLGIWASEADIGIFSVALRTSMLLGILLMSVNSILAPKFAALFFQGDTEAVAFLARKSVKILTIAAGPFLLLFLLNK